MPEIARFYGIIVSVFYLDHGRPHVHVRSGEGQASVDVETGRELGGELDPRTRRLIRAWLSLHRDAVRSAALLARTGAHPGRLPPLVIRGGKKPRAERDRAAGRHARDRGRERYPGISYLERPAPGVIRLFFTTGRIKDVAVPRGAAVADVGGGCGLRIGPRLDYSAPYLAYRHPGRVWARGRRAW